MTLQEFKNSLKPLYWKDLSVADALYAIRAGVVYMIMRNNNELHSLVVTDFSGTNSYKFKTLEDAQKKAQDMMRDKITTYFYLRTE